jgi:hypothetical protein
MQKHTLFNVVLTLSLVGTAALPGMAQTVVNSSPAMMPTTMSSPSSGIVIPQTSGVIVAFPAAVTVDAGKKEEYPLTLPLAQALLDSNGNVVVPENTPVSIKLKPINKGAQIIAESLVVGGQIVPIKATSPVIPGSVITQMKGNDKAIESGAVYGRLAGSVFGFMGKGDPDKFDQGAMIGSALGMLSGLKTPEKVRVVQIPQGSIFVLTLQSPINLPKLPQMQLPIAPAAIAPSTTQPTQPNENR